MVKRQNSSDENIFGSFLKLSERARFDRLLLKIYSLKHMYILTHYVYIHAHILRVCPFYNVTERFMCILLQLGRLGNLEDGDWLYRKSNLEEFICAKHSDLNQIRAHCPWNLQGTYCITLSKTRHLYITMERLRLEKKLPVCTQF